MIARLLTFILLFFFINQNAAAQEFKYYDRIKVYSHQDSSTFLRENYKDLKWVLDVFDSSGGYAKFAENRFNGNNKIQLNNTFEEQFYFSLRTNHIDTLEVSGTGNIFLKSESIVANDLKINLAGEATSLLMVEDNVNRLQINGGYKTIDIIKGKYKTVLAIQNCFLDGDFNISASILPDTLEIDYVRFTNPNSILNISLDSVTTKLCNILFVNAEISNMEIHIPYFNICFAPNTSDEEKHYIYLKLLENFTTRKQNQSYESADKQFRKFKYTHSGSWLGFLVNWIDKHWWDYGYNKYLVIRNAVLLNFFFFFINLFLFRKLVNVGYKILKFSRINAAIDKKYKNRFKNLLVKSPYIFLYTSYIFWGLKLDINNLSIHKLSLFSYVFLQYIVGLVCLAYLTNLIITV